MVWLNVADDSGRALYLETRNVERRGKGAEGVFVVTGIFGDGLFEGEVMVEVAEKTEVTFVDEWLNPAELRSFFRRVDREEAEGALRDAVEKMAGEGEGDEPAPCQPHTFRAQTLWATGVAEEMAPWEAAG